MLAADAGAMNGVVAGSGGCCHVTGPMATAVPETMANAVAAAMPAAITRYLNNSSRESDARTQPFAHCGQSGCCLWRTARQRWASPQREEWWSAGPAIYEAPSAAPWWWSEGAPWSAKPRVRPIKGGGDLEQMSDGRPAAGGRENSTDRRGVQFGAGSGTARSARAHARRSARGGCRTRCAATSRRTSATAAGATLAFDSAALNPDNTSRN